MIMKGFIIIFIDLELLPGCHVAKILIPLKSLHQQIAECLSLVRHD